jgi:hypothetical protein
MCYTKCINWEHYEDILFVSLPASFSSEIGYRMTSIKFKYIQICRADFSLVRIGQTWPILYT